MDFNSAVNHGVWFAYMAVFAGGLLTALTPCVFPLIPITVSIFGARQAVARSESALLSGLYVSGIAVMYTALGLLAASTGRAFGSVMGNRWIISAVAALFIVCALAMFGLFDLAPGAGLLTRLSRVGGEGRFGAFAMGIVAGVVAAPCTGPILGAVLTYVATTQKLIFGGSLLFFYAIGMGLPFFLVGTFAISLPKPGNWMQTIKGIFGILMLIVAAYFLKDVFPFLNPRVPSTSTFRLLTGAGAGLCLIGFSLNTLSKSKLVKTLLVASCVVLAHVAITSVVRSEIAAYTAEQWVPQSQRILADAVAAHKPVMIDFGADWCAACKELETKTYPSPRIAAELKRFLFIKVNDRESTAVQQYGGVGLPYVVFFDSQGRFLRDRTLTGFQTPQELLPMLQTIN
jgi:thioredoxin:protein disulfide reductase